MTTYKKVIALLPFATFLLGGCQTYSAFEALKKDDYYEKALLQTKSAQIINSLETKAKITATRLNPLYPDKYKDGEYFYVGVYIPDDYDKNDSAGLFNKEYKLYLKGDGGYMEPLSVNETIKKEQNELYKKAPIKDNWSRYYTVSFAKQKTDALTLKLFSPYGEALLNFQAER